ncbi:MAG: elongation factor Ts [Chloroflexota bacterium]|nr:MAG: elongation factor Ts [Chloroflexota bacterium]
MAITNNSNEVGIGIVLACETDFVAKNNDFVKLAYDIADIALNCKSKEELLNSPFGNSSVSEKLIEQTGVIGEKFKSMILVELRPIMLELISTQEIRFHLLVGFDKKIDNIETVGKDISMQIAAMNPIALDKESVDPELVKKEIEIAKDQLKTEGKPDELIEKIAIGKLNRFFKDNTLINQQFIKENKVSVAQHLKTFGDIKILSFSRVSIG